MRKRRHKKSKQDNKVKEIVLLTVIIQLINAVISLIKTLFE